MTHPMAALFIRGSVLAVTLRASAALSPFAFSEQPRTIESGPLGLPSAMLELLGMTSALGTTQSGAKSTRDRSFHSRFGAGERAPRAGSTDYRRAETGLTPRGSALCGGADFSLRTGFSRSLRRGLQQRRMNAGRRHRPALLRRAPPPETTPSIPGTSSE